MAKEKTVTRVKHGLRNRKVSEDKVTKIVKAEKKENATATPNDASDDESTGGAPAKVETLVSIEENPTPVDPAIVQTIAKEESDDKKVKQDKNQKMKPPSGLNRAARRRIQLIERQRDVIKKTMGIPEGSQDRADEVQKALDEWTENMDNRAAIRAQKKEVRKAKEASRLKSKRGKA
ncbi:hypothetical protein F5Y19DRAFT_286713 [Xylariaceae sp. FL1651]|nr:hypothetical protein F5Y19DRAFT_286713 [Xylariaceae sp. FL1651]